MALASDMLLTCSTNVYTTDDYIKLLYDLESGLYNDPYVSYHDISRDHSKRLNIIVKVRENAQYPCIKYLVDKAKLVGELAVHVQKFAAANIQFKSDIKDHVLEQVVVV